MSASSASVEWLIPVRQRNLEDRAAGVDDVDLHTDATIRVVQPIRADHLQRAHAGGLHRWRGAHSAMSSSLVGVMVARWNNAMER